MTAILPRYTVTDLGVLPGFESSRATNLNEKGQVIGSLRREAWDFSPVGFLWSEGKMRNLGNVRLTSINNKGQIVGTKPPKYHKFSAAIFSVGRFQDLLKNTSAVSEAHCINDCGHAVGYIQSTTWKTPADIKRGCFVWENGKRRYLSIPEGYKAGDAVAINNQGQIVGELWKGSPLETHACLWNEDTITIFDEPPGFNQSKAVAINNHGLIVVRAYQSNLEHLLKFVDENEKEWHSTDPAGNQAMFSLYEEKIASLPKDVPVFRQQAFLWQNGDRQAIDGLAEAVNDQAQVVGWSGCALGAEDRAKGRESPYAFLWQNGELIDLNDLLLPESGWRLTKANDINNHGQIVGHGEIDGKSRAFLLTPITL